ncbi:hypothetical protein BC833DRAFT_22950 [Globomyces pollinis-pini]|nr:hypothetical protein BC833DRAFT_22950 [Globomyces pollinis-pini]
MKDSFQSATESYQTTSIQSRLRRDSHAVVLPPRYNIFDTLDANAEEVIVCKANRPPAFSSFYKPITYADIRHLYALHKETLRSDPFRGTMATMMVGFKYPLKLLRKGLSENPWFFSVLTFVIDLVFTVLYLLEIEVNASQKCGNQTGDKLTCGWDGFANYFIVNRPQKTYEILLILSAIQLSFLITKILLVVDNWRKFITSLEFFVESITVTAFLSLFLVSFYTDNKTHNPRFIYIPYFLRVLSFVPNLKAILRVRRAFNIKYFSEYAEKFIILLAYIWALVYFGVCSFNYFESRGKTAGFKTGNTDGVKLDIVGSFYFIFITMSTVGYGDITPSTKPGQLIVILLIFLGLAFLPGLVGDLQETIRIQTSGAGAYTRGRNPFVVLCGEFRTSSRLLEMIYAILRRDNETAVVILSRRELPLDVKYKLKQHDLKQRVTYLHGTGLGNADLQRVQLNYAVSAFILASHYTPNHRIEDEHNTLRAWAFDRFAPDVPIFLETILPQTAYVQEDLATGIVCVDEFKQVFLGYNCLYRGVGTLFLNLLRGAKRYDEYEEPWEAQYGDGTANEIYKIPLNPLFTGKSFTFLSFYLFKEFQIILFALNTYIPEKDLFHVLLNPGNDYKMKSDDECFFIAQNLSDVSRFTNLTQAEFERSEEGSVNLKNAEQRVLIRTETDLVIPHRNTELQPKRKTDSIIAEYQYDIGYPPHTHEGKVPLCLLMPEPSKLKDVMLESAEHLFGHILVCSNNYHMFRFICTLRSANIRPSNLKTIVIMVPESPNEIEFSRFAHFPKVFFIKGYASKARHLRRAGLFKAERVVLTNLHNQMEADDNSSDGLADSSTIMISNMIHKMCAEQGLRNPVLLDVLRRSNIRFLTPGSTLIAPKATRKFLTKRSGHHSETINDVHFTPMFASGRIVCPVMLESILSAAYHEPLTIKLFNILCGVRYKLDSELEKLLKFNQSQLSYVLTPPEFVGKTFGQLYKSLCLNNGIIPIEISCPLYIQILPGVCY